MATWDEFRSSNAGARFTDWLRAQAGDIWDSVVGHPFTDQLAAATVDKDAMRRYLIQDHRFLDAFVVLLSSAISKMQCLEDRIPGCQFLALITGRENTYFERSFEALGVTAEDRATVPDAPVATSLIGVMRSAAASGELAQMLAVLVVAEWSYLSWGERVLPQRPSEPFWCYEWIDLHSGEGFQGVVAYLRGLLDKEVAALSAQDVARCQETFLETVRLEKAFFDMALGTSA
mmetsp:Transcript_36621/g.105364  ORF Transcript_36621/g.105364 Transcript_36621/m.105364 type:complete len:232 (+) Transcript_36621:61-756(+)